MKSLCVLTGLFAALSFGSAEAGIDSTKTYYAAAIGRSARDLPNVFVGMKIDGTITNLSLRTVYVEVDAKDGKTYFVNMPPATFIEVTGTITVIGNARPTMADLFNQNLLRAYRDLAEINRRNGSN